MIIDKYCREYSGEDLREEWQNKVVQFKIVQSEFKDFTHIFDALIALCEYILQTEYAEMLFPGAEFDKLKISPVFEGWISAEKMIVISSYKNNKGTFELTIINKGHKTKTIITLEEHLIGALIEYIQRIV